MTLYRENQNQHWGETNRMMNTLIDAKVLVPVDEPLLSRVEWEATYPDAVLLIERIDGQHRVTRWPAVGEEDDE